VRIVNLFYSPLRRKIKSGHPKLLGRQDDGGSRAVQANKFWRPHVNRKKMGAAVSVYHPSQGKFKIGGYKSRPACPKARSYPQNSQSKQGWRCDSSSRAKQR
jgi:hypothetical protein